jgi:predicted dithiol-disulfide oxidoreductase (DUF899 family)
VLWYSSYDTEFNYDFQVTLDPSIPQLHYNYRPAPELPSLIAGFESTPSLTRKLLELRGPIDGDHVGTFLS